MTIDVEVRDNVIISKLKEDVNYSEEGFALSQVMNGRQTQEDTLVIGKLDSNTLDSLTPEKIGERLWTTYHNLNDRFLTEYLRNESGTTAATTVIKNDMLITALVADAASFVVVYDEEGKVNSVTRLNSRTHKPTDADEKIRIESAGGAVIWGRVNGGLAVSRALGDSAYGSLICADANIDITSLAEIPLGCKVQVITTSDGFTDGAGQIATKLQQENFLKKCLSELNEGKPGNVSEEMIAKKLVDKASNYGPDNISVVVQTVKEFNCKPMFVEFNAAYDGHGGKDASHFVADNIANELRQQLSLTDEAYYAQKNSIKNKEAEWLRDNKDLTNKINKLQFIDAKKPVEKKNQQQESDKPQKQQQTNLDEQIAFLIATVNQIHPTRLAAKSSLKQTIDSFKTIDSNDLKAFKKSCIEAIQASRPSLEGHREYYRLLAYLALTATVVGIVAIIANEYSRAFSTGNRYLFLRTDSAKTLDKIEDAVNNLPDEKPSI